MHKQILHHVDLDGQFYHVLLVSLTHREAGHVQYCQDWRGTHLWGFGSEKPG